MELVSSRDTLCTVWGSPDSWSGSAETIQLLLTRHSPDSQALVLPDQFDWCHFPKEKCTVVFHSTAGGSGHMDLDQSGSVKILSGDGWRDFAGNHRLQCGHQLSLHPLPTPLHFEVGVCGPSSPKATPPQTPAVLDRHRLSKESLSRHERWFQGPSTPEKATPSKSEAHARGQELSGLAGGLCLLAGAADDLERLTGEPFCLPECGAPQLQTQGSSSQLEDDCLEAADSQEWEERVCKRPKLDETPAASLVGLCKGHLGSGSDGDADTGRDWCNELPWTWGQSKRPRCRLSRYLRPDLADSSSAESGKSVLAEKLQAGPDKCEEQRAVAGGPDVGHLMQTSPSLLRTSPGGKCGAGSSKRQSAGSPKGRPFEKSWDSDGESGGETDGADERQECGSGRTPVQGVGPDPMIAAEVFGASLKGPRVIKRVTGSMLGRSPARVSLPRSFASKVALGSSSITLIDDKDSSWPVQLELDFTCWGLEAGWSQFARASKLCAGDILVFHKVGWEQITTYIFRASSVPVKKREGFQKRGVGFKRKGSSSGEGFSSGRGEDEEGVVRGRGAEKAAEALQRKLKGPCLLRRMGTYCRKVLNLRADFGQELPVDSEGYFSLETTDGARQWQIRLNVNEHRFSLAHGWRKFAADNALQAGDVLLLEVANGSVKVHFFRRGSGGGSETTSTDDL